MLVKKNISLRAYNSFGIDVMAGSFYELHSVDDVREYISEVIPNQPQALILGGGSNVLLTKDVDTVAKIALHGRSIVQEDSDSVIVEFGAGENWHDCVTWAVQQGFGGIENLASIPGTIGAAPIQNIGAYGVELTSVFQQLQCLVLHSGEERVLYHSECQFGYRDSIFKHELKHQAVITSVRLRLVKNPVVNTGYKDVEQELESRQIGTASIQDVYDAVVAIRRRKLPDPKEIGNAGSFFKNPVVQQNVFQQIASGFAQVPHYVVSNHEVKIPAAWLIDQCGFKGIRRGNIGVHTNQALVLVNYGGGKGNEVYTLAQEIQQAVAQTFGVHLDMEVNII